ncbi:hypothetical protein WG66_013383, partial [Moniliophthora roreri]
LIVTTYVHVHRSLLLSCHCTPCLASQEHYKLTIMGPGGIIRDCMDSYAVGMYKLHPRLLHHLLISLYPLQHVPDTLKMLKDPARSSYTIAPASSPPPAALLCLEPIMTSQIPPYTLLEVLYLLVQLALPTEALVLPLIQCTVE